MLRKRLLTIVLGLTMIFQTTAVFAGTFSDLKDSEWAEPYIEKMAAKGIVVGFNGEYKPVNPVNKYEAVLMIYRTLKAAGKIDDAAVDAAVTKYASVITANSVPAWTDLNRAVAWMLENGVILPDELKYFMSGENHINARRYELCIFLGKALNVYLKENVNTFISLSFKDANLISSSSAPYVNLLVNKKIIQGDLDGNFKPYDPMTRAAMARVLSVLYDLLATGSTGTTTTTTPAVTAPSANVTTKEGVITYLIPDTQRFILTDKTSAAATEMYTVTSDVKIYYSGQLKTFSAISKDQNAKVTLTDGKLTRIDLGTWSSTSGMTLQKIEDRSGHFLLQVTDSSNNLKTYLTVTGLKKGILDGKEVELTKFAPGDQVQIRLNSDGHIIDITATTKVRTYDGILKSSIVFDGKPKLVFQTDNATELSLELASDLTIRRNDKSATAPELMVGDFVKIRAEYDKITRVEAYSVAKSTFSGRITQLNYGTATKMTVVSDDGVTKEYDVPASATITIDGSTTDVYALRPNYRVDLDLESASIVKIVAKKSQSKDQVAGVVTKVYKDLNLMTIRSTSAGGTQYLTVTFNGATRFISSTGGTISYINLDVDKSVFIYGNNQDNFFLAERVILLD